LEQAAKIKVVCVLALKSALNARQMFTAFAAGMAIMASGLVTPALASSDSADISAPLRAAQSARQSPLGLQSALGNGDSEFRHLFTSWRSLDRGGSIIAAPSNTGSIPSLMPVPMTRLTSGFGMRWHPVLGGRRAHMGVDLADPIGTPVHATGDGVIGRADWFSGYGLFVEIEHSGHVETRYGHMSRLNVAAGQFVHRGDVIGYVGMTGRTTGPHLHYEVRVNGVPVNPMPYMQGAGSAELARAFAAGSGDASATDAGDE
jgi:murein DD-endopeptidase MepM/ murein hydrolase activator NlpD